MAERDTLVRGYAEALFRVAVAEGDLDGVERQLFGFAKLLEKQVRLREALTDPALPAQNKRTLIAETMGERADPLAVNLLGLLVEQGHARELGEIVEALTEVAAETRQHAVAEVRSAVPLDDARIERLAEALSTATGRQIEVRVVVDPSVVGGVVAKIGDEIFDGSVRSRLLEARAHLSTTSTRSG